MLTTRLTHPQVLHGLAAAGHGSLVLVADANYPVSTATHPNAWRVHLNLTPGVVAAESVVAALLATIPIEEAIVMSPNVDGLYTLAGDPPVWAAYRRLLAGAGQDDVPLIGQPRHDFYDTCRGSDLALAVVTGETQMYANLVLRIGVRREPEAGDR